MNNYSSDLNFTGYGPTGAGFSWSPSAQQLRNQEIERQNALAHSMARMDPVILRTAMSMVSGAQAQTDEDKKRILFGTSQGAAIFKGIEGLNSHGYLGDSSVFKTAAYLGQGTASGMLDMSTPNIGPMGMSRMSYGASKMSSQAALTMNRAINRDLYHGTDNRIFNHGATKSDTAYIAMRMGQSGNPLVYASVKNAETGSEDGLRQILKHYIGQAGADSHISSEFQKILNSGNAQDGMAKLRNDLRDEDGTMGGTDSQRKKILNETNEIFKDKAKQLTSFDTSKGIEAIKKVTGDLSALMDVYKDAETSFRKAEAITGINMAAGSKQSAMARRVVDELAGVAQATGADKHQVFEEVANTRWGRYSAVQGMGFDDINQSAGLKLDRSTSSAVVWNARLAESIHKENTAHLRRQGMDVAEFNSLEHKNETQRRMSNFHKNYKGISSLMSAAKGSLINDEETQSVYKDVLSQVRNGADEETMAALDRKAWTAVESGTGTSMSTYRKGATFANDVTLAAQSPEDMRSVASGIRRAALKQLNADGILSVSRLENAGLVGATKYDRDLLLHNIGTGGLADLHDAKSSEDPEMMSKLLSNWVDQGVIKESDKARVVQYTGIDDSVGVSLAKHDTSSVRGAKASAFKSLKGLLGEKMKNYSKAQSKGGFLKSTINALLTGSKEGISDEAIYVSARRMMKNADQETRDKFKNYEFDTTGDIDLMGEITKDHLDAMRKVGINAASGMGYESDSSLLSDLHRDPEVRKRFVHHAASKATMLSTKNEGIVKFGKTLTPGQMATIRKNLPTAAAVQSIMELKESEMAGKVFDPDAMKSMLSDLTDEERFAMDTTDWHDEDGKLRVGDGEIKGLDADDLEDALSDDWENGNTNEVDKMLGKGNLLGQQDKYGKLLLSDKDDKIKFAIKAGQNISEFSKMNDDAQQAVRRTLRHMNTNITTVDAANREMEIDPLKYVADAGGKIISHKDDAIASHESIEQYFQDKKDGVTRMQKMHVENLTIDNIIPK